MKLLDVQELDSQIDTLRHQLDSIPEAAALAERLSRRAELDGGVRDLRVQISDLAREQRRAEADVEQVKTRSERDQGMVDSGAVQGSKALERLLGELESLRRRIDALEEVQLEVMERAEATEDALRERSVELEKVDKEAAALEATRAYKAAELETSLGRLLAERKTTAAGLPADLLALYEKLRRQKGGVGAAALRRKECGGCRLTLNASDLGIIAKAAVDEVIRCEECNRILVRTSDSGL